MQDQFDPEPSVEEIEKVLVSTLNENVLRADGILTELLEQGDSYLGKKLHSLFCQIWQEAKTSADFKGVNILKIYERKGPWKPSRNLAFGKLSYQRL